MTVAEKQDRKPVLSDTQARRAAPLRGLLPLVVALIVWQMLASKAYPYFPPPSDWIKALSTLAAAGRLQPALLTTLSSFFSALFVCVTLGTALGILLGRSRSMDRLFGPLLEFGRTMPGGAVIPVAVLLMGYTQSMTLFVVTLTSIWPILLNVRTAAMRVSPDRLDVARVFHLRWWETQTKVLLPSVFPSIQLGTQTAAPVILIIVLLVEILTQVSGIGREIALAQSTFRSATVYGLVILTGVLGLIVNWSLSFTGYLLRNFENPAA